MALDHTRRGWRQARSRPAGGPKYLHFDRGFESLYCGEDNWPPISPDGISQRFVFVADRLSAGRFRQKVSNLITQIKAARKTVGL
jgi:hypothetical protein